jgi:sugar phosphate isomerase/epimerase
MKIGVKTFDNGNFLKPFEDKVDFFEVMAIENVDYSFLKELHLPIVIHSQHRGFGVNIADKTKLQKNLTSINFAIDLANKANAKKIILHPGELDNKDCSREQAINFIKSIRDKRIIIENIPPEETKRLGETPEEIKEILKVTKKGFCFDINHAIITAIELKLNYEDLIKEFVKLKPNHYHLGGQARKTDHLALSESNFDLKKIISFLPRDAEITLEVSTDLKKTLNDVRLMKNIIKELKV